MKRMDRMMAIVMALQQRAETAQSLADKLEVSKRTVLRDVQALSELGVPLVAVSGPGGGYRLMEGYHLPPLQLTAEEALTLLMALDGMAKYSDGPFREARWTAKDKIRSVLPRQLRTEERKRYYSRWRTEKQPERCPITVKPERTSCSRRKSRATIPIIPDSLRKPRCNGVITYCLVH